MAQTQSLGSALLLLALAVGPSLAGSATWQATPGSGEWNLAGNWSPGTVPNAPTDTATFGTSSITALFLPSSATIDVDGITFDAGASAYTITAAPPYGVFFRGAGITNNSGVTQNFVTETDAGGSYGGLLFYNSSTAGTNMAFTNRGSIVPYPWGTGYAQFMNTSNAGSGTITNQGGTGANSFGGYTQFFDSADAGSATLIANGGVDGGGGGKMVFSQNSTGGTAIVEVYDNGFLDIDGHSNTGLTIGSLAGTGNIFLGDSKLTVGSNGLSTTFSGAILDGTGLPPGGGGTGGSFAKIGAGTFELTNGNTYTGATTISEGTLKISNSSGSAFGSGTVTVEDGATLTGDGSFTGDLQLNGMLSPGNSPGTISAGSTTFGGGGSYLFEINSVNGNAGQATGWDWLSIGGSLDIAATSGDGFTFFVTSLTQADSAGELFDFNPNADYSFVIASTVWGIYNFDADDFELDFTGFSNSFTGTWTVESNGADLALVYSGSAVPEPSTYGAMAVATLLGFACWRRRAVSTAAA